VRFAPYRGIDFMHVDNKDASLFPVAIADHTGNMLMALLQCPLFPATAPEETVCHDGPTRVQSRHYSADCRRWPSVACTSSTWSGTDRAQPEFGMRACGQLPQFKPIQVHHLGPGRHEVVQELLLRIRASVHFSQCP
jgi:hypothetical protein